MSYDLRLARPRPDTSLEQLFERIMTDQESDEAAPTDPSVERFKAQIAASILADLPRMTQFEFDHADIAAMLQCTEDEARRRFRHIELNQDDTGAQITIYDEQISMSLPYGHEGAAAWEALGQLGSVCHALAERWGFVTFDPQLGRIVDWDADMGAVVAAYSRVTSASASVESEDAPAETAVKPWWKFW